ncbi:MAG: hydroxyacid dehydrogenase, partial [Ilumatobacteraceae bacterium]|nr:hydroxyacid dehydrogenase [Ilumatobacteraceae bacterium]
MVEHLFTADQRARLAAVGEIVDPLPFASFDDDRAAKALAQAEILVGHWGCPTLTPDVMALAPKLALFAYGAGTVKWQVTDAVWDRGVAVTSAAAANAVPVADYAVGAILLANKGVFLVREMVRNPG